MRLPQDKILHIDTEFKDGKMNVVAEWQGELVRCKDCKHRDPEDGRCDHGAINFLLRRTDDNYCSYGERKGDDIE